MVRRGNKVRGEAGERHAGLGRRLALVLWGLTALPGAAKTLQEFLADIAPAELVPGGASFGPAEGEPPLVPILDAAAGARRLGLSQHRLHQLRRLLRQADPHRRRHRRGRNRARPGARRAPRADRADRHPRGRGDGRAQRAHRPGDAARSPPGRRSCRRSTSSRAPRSPCSSWATASCGRPSSWSAAAGSTDRRSPERPLPPPARELDMAQDRGPRLADAGRRRLGAQPAAVRRRGQPGLRRRRACRPPPGARRRRTPRTASSSSTSRRSSVPAIGRSLLGEAGYERLAARLKPGQGALLIAGDGAYSFKGSAYVRGGIFDRVELIQDGQGTRFRDRNHTRLNGIAAEGAPRLKEVGLFVVPEDFAFDVTEPFDAAAPRAAGDRGPRQGDAAVRPRLCAARSLSAAGGSAPPPAAPRRRRPRRLPALPTRRRARRSGSRSGR